MSALTIIHKQLCEILHLMKQDLNRNEYVNNYFICEDDCKLLPKQELQEYLTTTKIENTFFLLGINKLCVEIIEIWNNDFQLIKMREFRETFHSERILSATAFFKAIHLTEEKWHFYDSIKAKKEFTNSTNYKNYQIAHIAERCGLILNWITASYQHTGTDIIEKYNYEHYLNRGRFHFQITVKSFYSHQFEYASSKIDNFEKSYLYILNKLNKIKRIEFKNDTLDHLKKVEKYQKVSKFKALIRNTILRIEKESKNINVNLGVTVKPNVIDRILPKLNEYKFSDLEKLKGINVKEFCTHLFANNLPYTIAYLSYLDFINYLDNNYCKSNIELHKLLAKILECDDRMVRGNINGLKNEKSTDRKRYTAYKHTEKVKKHYQTLK